MPEGVDIPLIICYNPNVFEKKYPDPLNLVQ